MGQTATSASAGPKSALPPKADVPRAARHVRKVPKPEVRPSSFDHLVGAGEHRQGIVRPSLLAVLRFTFISTWLESEQEAPPGPRHGGCDPRSRQHQRELIFNGPVRQQPDFGERNRLVRDNGYLILGRRRYDLCAMGKHKAILLKPASNADGVCDLFHILR